MEFNNLIKERYSCKKYNETKVDRDVLLKILEAAKFAPTAKNSQEQKIYVIESQEGLEKVDLLTPCRYGAKTVLMFAYDVNGEYTYTDSELKSGVEDVTIVATHVMLSAKNEGVETCWLNKFNPKLAKEIFDLPENENVVLLMDIGFPAPEGKPLINHTNRKDVKEYIIYK